LSSITTLPINEANTGNEEVTQLNSKNHLQKQKLQVWLFVFRDNLKIRLCLFTTLEATARYHEQHTVFTQFYGKFHKRKVEIQIQKTVPTFLFSPQKLSSLTEDLYST
jgi:hypothetical protein